MSTTQRYCQHCGTVGTPRSHTKGSFFMELFLWCLLLLPGFIYTIWRLTTRAKVCPTCRAPNMIPLDSPVAQAALAARASVDPSDAPKESR